ncbi:hypothetical protein HAX54_005985 [Datura stramonium]|uniref:Mitochondrial import inner membrane translocase subunit Tim16 n=1 Tax=Datura stramonium TaxID=4076 RepID=A0ABS8RIB1_DATST|nr:hypothetical protein [Datura stramonium]
MTAIDCVEIWTGKGEKWNKMQTVSFLGQLQAWINFQFPDLGYLVPNFTMAAKILANLIVMGSTILARSFVQAYRQALANASKNGVAQEAVQNIKRASKTMTEAEARQILGVTENSSWEEIVQRYGNLFEQNAKNGSFYLQSKVHRAKECLEAIHQPKEPEEK